MPLSRDASSQTEETAILTYKQLNERYVKLAQDVDRIQDQWRLLNNEQIQKTANNLNEKFENTLALVSGQHEKDIERIRNACKTQIIDFVAVVKSEEEKRYHENIQRFQDENRETVATLQKTTGQLKKQRLIDQERIERLKSLAYRYRALLKKNDVDEGELSTCFFLYVEDSDFNSTNQAEVRPSLDKGDSTRSRTTSFIEPVTELKELPEKRPKESLKSRTSFLEIDSIEPLAELKEVPANIMRKSTLGTPPILERRRSMAPQEIKLNQTEIEAMKATYEAKIAAVTEQKEQLKQAYEQKLNEALKSAVCLTNEKVMSKVMERQAFILKYARVFFDKK